MRVATLTALTAVMIVSGCSAEKRDGQGTPTQPASGASPVSLKGRADADEARTFILSKLEPVERGADLMRYYDVSLGSRWVWRETVHTVVADRTGVSATEKTETYQVDPAQLRVPVRVVGEEGSYSISFECAVANCLSVRGALKNTFQFVTESDPTTTETAINERRSSNFWWFKDRNSAERTAKAMNALLLSQGARESAF